LIIGLGVGKNLYYANRLSGYLDGDSATIGLMADDVLHGKIHIFFYGQEYNGSLEYLWLVPFIYLFGLSPFVCMAGLIALYGVFLLTTYELGRLIKNKYIGLLAMTYCAICPYPLLHNAVFSYGYRISIMVLGNLILIISLLIDRNRRNVLLWILLGLTAGLGFWNHLSIVYYLVTAFIFLCINKDIFRNFLYYIVAAVFFFIGSLPFWIRTVQTKFITFKLYEQPGWSYKYVDTAITTFQAVKRIFTYHIAGLLGAEQVDFFAFIVWGVIASGGVVFLWRVNKKKMILLIFLCSFLFFSLQHKIFIDSPKYGYFIPLYIVISIWFAYFLDWTYSKSRYLSVGIFLFIVSFNISDLTISANEGRKSKEDINLYNENVEKYDSLLKFINENHIKGVIVDFVTAQGINLMTNRKISAGELLNGRVPEDTKVAEKNNVSFFDCTHFIKSSVNSISKEFKRTDISGHSILYGFKPHDYYGREIDPVAWKARSNYNSEYSKYGFDRTLKKNWTSGVPKRPNMYFEVDLGRVYNVYRLIVLNFDSQLANYPEKYAIETSKDGIIWNKVNAGRQAQPLFWSGPRIYWDYYNGRWEIIFKPVNARFIRIKQLDFGKWPWIIDELFIYEYSGDKKYTVRDYVYSAKKIYQYAFKEKIGFIYADHWLSAKIQRWSNGEIGSLDIRNECFPDRKYVSRLMEINENTLIVVNKSDADLFEKMLVSFELPVDKECFGENIGYRFILLNDWQKFFLKRQKCFYWTGINIAKINMHIYSQILTEYGKLLADSGDILQAMNYYKKAVEVSPRDITARKALIEYYKGENLSNEYKKQLLKYNHLCVPKVKKEIEFKNGVKFLGYSIFQYKGKLRITYYWKFPKKISKDIDVFVHFVKNGKIVFQNDHYLLSQYPEPVISYSDCLFIERYWIKVPEVKGSGVYDLVMGLYTSANGKRIRIKKDFATKCTVGSVKVSDFSTE
jgi:hypothetical protein